LKNLAWLLLLLGSLTCWAQQGAMAVNAEGASPPHLNNPPRTFDNSIVQVRNLLGLTPEQQPLWRAYESKVDAYTARFYQEKPVVSALEDTAPHQIGRLVDNLQNRLATLEDLEQAAKSLYASLTPEQQKTANQMLLSTIPVLTSSAPGSSPAKEEGRSKEGKAEGGSRPRRSGGSGGLGGGGF